VPAKAGNDQPVQLLWHTFLAPNLISKCAVGDTDVAIGLLKYWRADGTRRINGMIDIWQIFRAGPAGTVGVEMFGIVFRAGESTHRKSATSITARGPLGERQRGVNLDAEVNFVELAPDQNKVMPGEAKISARRLNLISSSKTY
jgi:hypothetical protein